MAGKRDPTLSRPPTPPPQVYASPNWILYYRSSQVWTTHFPPPLFAFFHSFLLSRSRFYFCLSFFLFVSVLVLYFSISFRLLLADAQNVLCFPPSVSVWSGLSSSPCLIEFSRMCRGTHCCDKNDNNLTRSPSSWCCISIRHQLFALFALVSVYWSGLTGHIYSITHLYRAMPMSACGVSVYIWIFNICLCV